MSFTRIAQVLAGAVAVLELLAPNAQAQVSAGSSGTQPPAPTVTVTSVVELTAGTSRQGRTSTSTGGFQPVSSGPTFQINWRVDGNPVEVENFKVQLTILLSNGSSASAITSVAGTQRTATLVVPFSAPLLSDSTVTIQQFTSAVNMAFFTRQFTGTSRTGTLPFVCGTIC